MYLHLSHFLPHILPYATALAYLFDRVAEAPDARGCSTGLAGTGAEFPGRPECGVLEDLHLSLDTEASTPQAWPLLSAFLVWHELLSKACSGPNADSRIWPRTCLDPTALNQSCEGLGNDGTQNARRRRPRCSGCPAGHRCSAACSGRLGAEGPVSLKSDGRVASLFISDFVSYASSYIPEQEVNILLNSKQQP